jgi:MoaA/NifB/PqqE/SkfB family radical SAM enzyme
LQQLAQVPSFRMVAFTGGEPLPRHDLYDLLAYSRRLGFKNTLATNATLIDHAAAQDLRRRGVAIAAVSLDGLGRETHDRLRGVPGAFDAAVEGMRALCEVGIVLHINIDELDGLLDLADELHAGIVLMYQLVPTGLGRSIGEADLDVETNERLIRFMAEAQQRSHAIMEPVAGPQYWPYLLKRARIRGKDLLRVASTIFHGCCAGKRFCLH